MSKWLQNVGQFLEKLDDQAEQIGEETRALQDGEEPLEAADAIENILAARGLSGSLHDESGFPDDDLDDLDLNGVEDELVTTAGSAAVVQSIGSNDTEPFPGFDNVEAEPQPAETKNSQEVEAPKEPTKVDSSIGKSSAKPSEVTSVPAVPKPEASAAKDDSTPPDSIAKSEDASTGEGPTTPPNEPVMASEEAETTPVTSQSRNQSLPPQMANDALAVADLSMEEQPDVFSTPAEKALPQVDSDTPFFTPARTSQKAPPAPKPHTPAQPKPPAAPENSQVFAKLESSTTAARQSQKEARTLRRHVVTLNKQLETAETEMHAQRSELERAAERMEKDRLRQKQEREKEKTRHAQEIKSSKEQQEQALKAMRQRTDQQLRDIEDQRSQEGGDWNKDMTDAVRREHEMASKCALLEDEKATFLSQIATLQAQQEALGNRLESLTHTSDNAMERERDAEDRLDAALSLHARQISQRQSREAELEKTVSELGAALVAAGNKASNGAPDAQSAGDETGQNPTTDVRLQSLEQEAENLHGQLAHERDRNENLKRELLEVSKEYTEEASVIHSRQQIHDRHVGELTQTISKLKAELRESKTGSRRGSGDRLGADDSEDVRQIKSLSEEVLRQREKVGSSSSEISALKSRLSVALDRAAKAEDAAEAARGSTHLDIERGPASGNGMRRRGGGRKTTESNGTSMRSALNLDVVQGEGSERVGKSLDALDKFLVDSGKFLRYNPLARLIFIVYLLMLHLWTFLLLFVHAHTFEDVHGDFGAGGTQAHGPHALMQQSPLPIPTMITMETPAATMMMHVPNLAMEADPAMMQVADGMNPTRY